MESEKVKEILKFCSKGKDCYDGCPYKHDTHCVMKISKEALTLINELESENDTLHTNLCEWRKENQQLKDRIAELEKENARLLNSVKTVQSNRCVYKCVLTKEHLTKFAERLKEKFVRQEERFATDVTRFETDLNKVKESDLPTAKFLIGKATGQATMAEKAQYYIDETLKEFIDE